MATTCTIVGMRQQFLDLPPRSSCPTSAIRLRLSPFLRCRRSRLSFSELCTSTRTNSEFWTRIGADDTERGRSSPDDGEGSEGGARNGQAGRESDEPVDLGSSSQESTSATNRQPNESTGFWGSLRRRFRKEIDEVNGSEAVDEVGAGDEIESEDTEQLEGGFWRRFRAKRRDGYSREDELLLDELENLDFEWKEFFKPTTENLLALGFTALVALAGLQVIWQAVTVATAITFAALKYTVLAAIVVGLLVFLL